MMTLQQYRKEIDRIDRELTALFAKRMAVSAKIAAYKKANGLPILDARRESEKLTEIESMLPEELKEYGAALYERLFALSRDWQERAGNEIENILLIGMPGCGKSTLARMLGEKLRREAFDCDEWIEQKAGMTVPELFARHGEAVFRDWETKALEELCRGFGRIIATGGGCVTREENIRLLRGAGTVVWLRRPLDRLSMEGRPISLSRGLGELYAERAPLYEKLSDIVIENDSTLAEAVERIVSALKAKEGA